MDAKLFEVLGKYAGLGGFSIGLVLLVFRDLLKKSIFPKLATDQAYLLIRQLMYLTFAIGALGIVAWVVVSMQGTGSKLKTEPNALNRSADPPAVTPGSIPEPAEIPIIYYSDLTFSGECNAFGSWATVCTPNKPPGWKILYQHFDLTGDRDCRTHAECKQVGPITATKVCYKFRTQGHNEECGTPGQTGVHPSKGALAILWKRPPMPWKIELLPQEAEPAA